MSTSDHDGREKLTRKQLREIRLTGSTPVITETESAAAAARPVTEPAAVTPAPVASTPAKVASVEPVVTGQALTDDQPAESGGRAPMTRRRVRAQERARTDSVPVQSDIESAATEDAVEPSAPSDAATGLFVGASDDLVVEDAPAPVATAPVTSEPAAPTAVEEPAPAPTFGGTQAEETAPVLVSAVPTFEPATAPTPRFDSLPVAEPEASDTVAQDDAARERVASIFDQPADDVDISAEPDDSTEDSDATDGEPQERPMVGAAFGIGVKSGQQNQKRPALFDDLIDGSNGSQHAAPNALIFTPSPGVGSLSGPIASTGEVLVTGTYSLPEGLGSQGHALGLADGKDVDAVLLDGELAPASSPTPIAASSAVSTSKPAGEVIRPPSPDKGSKLMLTLAIVAGGLALALAAALIIAFTSNVFGG